MTTGSWYPVSKVQHSGPVLVATDGTVAGQTAFRAASDIAPGIAGEVRVVVVVEPLPVLVPEPSVIMQPLVASPELLDMTRDRVIAQLHDISSDSADWRVDVEYGKASGEIVDKSRDCDAQVIVMGLVHHGIMDRILDGDTALEVVRQSEAPVLLASETWKAQPSKLVVAVDFSPTSMHAARFALRIAGKGATVVLAHVRPTAVVFEGAGIWEEEYDKSAEHELARFAEGLAAPADVDVRTVVLRGSTSSALLHFADAEDADLIAAGTRGAGFAQRILLGSVAVRLMRHTQRSLLIAPDSKIR